MINNSRYVIVILLVLAMGCKQHSQQAPAMADTQAKTGVIMDTLGLKLDQGKKWVANLETQEGVEKMDSLITAFKHSGSTAYQSLGEDLSEQTGYIIKNCTMQGESHEQLHVVLLPMLSEISILKDSSATNASKKALNELDHLINGYFDHFKSPGY